jgi:hypothetical protein
MSAPILPLMPPGDMPLPDLTVVAGKDYLPSTSTFVEKQRRLLTEPLFGSWAGPGEGRPFVALANVGYFFASRQPPLVPDVLLSLDAPAGPLSEIERSAYFQWLMGKPPDLIIEIVSDQRGGEEDVKARLYARQGVTFYVIFDPDNILGHGVFRAYALEPRRYVPIEPNWLPEIGLGLTLWPGAFEGHERTWLRWCDRAGRVIPPGAECAAARA